MAATQTIHLGFDMGIRNLAYCLVRHDISGYEILAWDNIDLLEGGISSQDAKKCIGCGCVAKWISQADSKKWCNSCATQKRVKKAAREKPTLPPFSGPQTVKNLRDCALAAGVDPKGMKKEALLGWAAGRYLMPWKPVKAMDTGLQTIRSAMDRWLDSVLPITDCP